LIYTYRINRWGFLQISRGGIVFFLDC